MKIKEIETILENSKLESGEKIIINKRFDDFSFFTVENKIGFILDGKITKKEIELYGVGDDMFFEATKENINSLLKIINHSLNNAYVVNFYDESKSKISTLTFVDEYLIEFNQVIEECKNSLREFNTIKFAEYKSAKYNFSYEFSF